MAVERVFLGAHEGDAVATRTLFDASETLLKDSRLRKPVVLDLAIVVAAPVFRARP